MKSYDEQHYVASYLLTNHTNDQKISKSAYTFSLFTKFLNAKSLNCTKGTFYLCGSVALKANSKLKSCYEFCLALHFEHSKT